MGDPGTVRPIEGIGDLRGIGEGLFERQRAFGDARGKGFALDQLHHHVVRADVEESADVRMIQRSDRSRFAFEAGSGVLALGDVAGEDLDGDGAVEPRVAGSVHFAHAARAQWGEDLVRAQLLTYIARHDRE